MVGPARVRPLTGPDTLFMFISTTPDGEVLVFSGAGYYWVDGIMYRFDELPADLRQANDALETMTSVCHGFPSCLMFT